MKSIIQSNKECYFCGSKSNLHSHHVFPGSNRKNSEKYGLKAYLCVYHHHLSNDSVHLNPGYMKMMRIIGQLYFEKTYTEDFIKVFGKNYRED